MNKKMIKKGFTLIEVMVAVFIMIVGIFAAITLMQKTLAAASFSSSRLIAAYLAQEGIELIRNTKDGNFLEGVAFDDGMASGTWEVDYTGTQVAWTGAGRYLNLAGGFYSYQSGIPTSFKRKITIQNPQPYMLKIVAEVSWVGQGKTYYFSAGENLYNWSP